MDDKGLWEMAKSRVNFRKSLYTYVIINAFLWLIWILENMQNTKAEPWSFPWPIYPLIGWGLGLVFYYLRVYSHTGEAAVKAEYEKLKRSKKEKNDRA